MGKKNKEAAEKKVSEQQQMFEGNAERVLEVITAEGPKLTIDGVVAMSGLTKMTVLRHMLALAIDGKIKKEQFGRVTVYVPA